MSSDSNIPKPTCFAVGCTKEGKFVCKRCKTARFCSTSCQQTAWPEHKNDCSDKLGKDKPYLYDYYTDRTIPEKKWLLSDMKKGPVQPMDPPEEYDDYSTWWYNRTVEIGGKVVVNSSFFPPKMKEVIRKALRNRDLTWEYLFSDNFMSMACYAWVPLQLVLEQLIWIVIPATEKPRLQGIVENIVEHYWRVMGLPGQLEYDPKVGALLQKLNITLPFTDSHCYEDELRAYTHDLSQCTRFGPSCDCFTCLARPLKDARAREAWEVLRRRVAKKGMYMMSWSAKVEYEAQYKAEEEQNSNTDTTTTPVNTTSANTAPPASTAPDTTSKVTVLQWTHGPDEQKTVKSSFTKVELAELGKYIDVIHKQQRLPLDEEMDWIMRKVSVSQDRYKQETRREVEAAVKQRLQQQNSGGSSGGKNKGGGSSTASATSAVATTRTPTLHTTDAVPSTGAYDPHTPRPSLDRPPPVSGTKAGTTSTTSTSTATAHTTSNTASNRSTSGEGDNVEQCTKALSAVEINTTSTVVVGTSGSGSAAAYTTTGRPQRRAAAKVVSYVAAGPSSSEDERGVHRHSDDSVDSGGDGGGKGSGDKKGRSKGRGGGSDSGESEGWSDDTSETESSSDDSSNCDSSNSGDVSDVSEGEMEGVSGSVKPKRRTTAGTTSVLKINSTGGGAKAKKVREPGAEDSSRAAWTPEMDARLTEAVGLYKEEGWTRVAEVVGGGVSGMQCRDRWSSNLKPQQQGLRKRADWTEAELAALPGLVQQYTIAPYWSEKYKVMTQERIDWKSIGWELHRVPSDCVNKWNSILRSKMKKGPFTAEEDALIRQRVVEWENKGQGVWVSLEKELGRPSRQICQRWNKQQKNK